jgi:hypothetical protein
MEYGDRALTPPDRAGRQVLRPDGRPARWHVVCKLGFRPKPEPFMSIRTTPFPRLSLAGLALVAAISGTAAASDLESTIDDAPPATTHLGLSLGVPFTGGGNDGVQTFGVTVSIDHAPFYLEGDFQRLRSFTSGRDLVGLGAGAVLSHARLPVRFIVTAHFASADPWVESDGRRESRDTQQLGGKATVAWTSAQGLDLRFGVAVLRDVGDPGTAEPPASPTAAYAFTRVGWLF